MDQKTWLWKKKSSEKTIFANGKADFPLKENAKEVQLPNEKEVALEESLKILNERLTSLLSECNAKEEERENHARMAQEAKAGQEKAEAELLHLRKELDDVLQEKFTANERISSLNAALKNCMQQLTSVREEQEQRLHDAIMKTSKEFEKAHNRLEEKLSESSKRIANLTVENSHLSKTLAVKEELVKELANRRSQVEAEFDVLMSRLDTVEKENAFLRYELRMLEKDLDIRNEEIEFSHRSAEASEKQQLESLKKIKKLEAECQRLRVLVRKRMPGSTTALANVKSQVDDVQGRCNTETRRRKLSPRGGGELDISNKRISFLVERLQNVEQENKILRDVLANKGKDICHSSTKCTQIIAKSSSVGPEIAKHNKNQGPRELTLPNELSSISSFNSFADSDSNCSRSWASALISELENFKDGDCKSTPEHRMIETSDMSLMDDFVEMEKLAIVAVDVQNKSSHNSSDMHHVPHDSPKGDTNLNDMGSTGKELVLIGNDDLDNMNRELQTTDLSSQNQTDWLQTVLKVIIEQVRVSERSIDELLEDIKIGFQSEAERAGHSPHSGQYELSPIAGYLTWKSPVTSPNSFEGVSNICSSREEKLQKSIQPISSSIGKIIELVGRFDSTCTKESTLLSDQLTANEDYAIHVFGWKNCELAIVVQQFISTCDSLLNRKIDFEKFAAELSSTLEWILGKSTKNQDNSRARHELKHHFNKNGSGTSTEHESLQKFLMEMEKNHSVFEVENNGLKNELTLLKSLQKDVEQSRQVARDEIKALTVELELSHESVKNLQNELEALRESRRMIEDQFENQKSINEDLDTQLTVTKVRLNEVSQKLSSVEVELEDKSHCFHELEGTCLELQLQLESFASKEILEGNINQEEKLLQTGWEIKAASAKLAECEATILNLGNQLKALATPREAPTANRILYNYRNSKKLKQRFSLLDQMISEDTAGAEVTETPNTKDIRSTTGTHRHPIHQMNSQIVMDASNDQIKTSGEKIVPPDEEPETALTGALAVVPSKKRGGGFGFLRKLLLRRKRRSSHKTFFPFSP